MVGIIKSVKMINTRSGKMAFATLADFNGEIEMAFFPRAWERCQEQIEEDKVAIVRGKIDYQEDKDRYSFISEECIGPADAEALLDREDTMRSQLDEYRAAWEAEVKLNLSLPEKAESGEDYLLIGILKNLRPFQTQKGNDMASATLVDYNGEIGVTIFPKAWTTMQDELEEDSLTALRGKIKKDNYKNRYAFYPDTVMSLKRLKSKYRDVEPGPAPAAVKDAIAPNAAFAGAVHIRLEAATFDRDETLYPLRDYLAENSGPCPLYIHLALSDGEKVIRTATGIGAAAKTEALLSLKNCAGVAEVWSE